MKESEIIIQELARNRAKTSAVLALLKRKFAKKYKSATISNVELLKAYRKLVKNKKIKADKKIEGVLRKRGIRSLSGVAVVSVLTKPYPCPGRCLYCPTVKGLPKSYLPNEPAAMRAVFNKFHPYSQVKTRLQALGNTGHPTDKIELIVIGGTWSYLPQKYQIWFIKKCFDACNQKPSKTLEAAQKLNESAKHRIIGITLETRPDYINEKEIKMMHKLGATRVELGVQSIYDDILKLNNRGHDVAQTIKATKLLKDAGFKICYHVMPNLPGSDLKKDEKMFNRLFSQANFRPDLLKIYPCVVVKEAPLYKIWKAKKYRPYNDGDLINLLKKFKKTIPYYARIQRLIRDIPSPDIIAGCKISNLRQLLLQLSQKERWRCRCVRCREVGREYNPKEKLILFRQDYRASDGKEIFLSFENKGREKLYSLLRLRISSCVLENKGHFWPVLDKAAIIREVHTYGQLHPINNQGKLIASPQHKGLGKKLMAQAEKIAAQEFGLRKIAVISGVGARNYYRKLGYELKDTYMVKKT